jgi:NADPH2:quinone reductase
MLRRGSYVKTFALSEAAAAHAYIESRQVVGRVLLIP